MKKELLRMQNVCAEASSDPGIFRVSIHLLEGECVGLLGLANSGKDTLVQVLTGEIPYDNGIFIICKEKLTDTAGLKKVVYRMSDRNYLISDWTVYEYLGLVDNRSFLGLANKKKLIKDAQLLMTELGIPVDVRRTLREISELEKRLIDVAKACRQKARILLIEDEFEGLSKSEIMQFKKELKVLVKGRMAVVISSHSDMAVNLISDRFILFKEGKIAKKCRNENLPGISHLEKYMLGETIKTKKQSLDNIGIEKMGQSEAIYEVYADRAYEKQIYDFSFKEGEVSTILALDKKEKELIFKMLSGHISKPGIKRMFENMACEYMDIADFVRNGIVSVQNLGDMEELLPCMSAGENILIPSLNKITPMEYTLAGNRIAKMLEKESYTAGTQSIQRVKELSVNDRIALTLERWYVYNPKVMILFEPFIRCDTYGVSLVKSYIKQMAGNKTAVVVVKSREEYMEEISDHFTNV